jgi:hypothetical protein
MERVDYHTYSQKVDKTDCSNYRGISLLSTSYKILSDVPLARLTPYADETTGDHQCGFRCEDERLIIFYIYGTYWSKSGSVMVQTSAIYRF